MRDLDSEWRALKRRLAEARGVWVGVDFDGTLVPIAASPGIPRLDARRRRILEGIAASPRARVAIVSGRALADLAGRTRVRGAVLIGNHGFESRLPGRPAERAYRPAHRRSVAAAAREARAALRDIPGLRWEDKGPVVAVHVRRAPPAAKPRVAGILAAAAADRRPGIVVRRGKEVFELRPALPVDKGRALRDVRRRLGGTRGEMIWYFGDDATDEDAFRTLPRRAVTVHVGAPSDRSRARFCVPSPGGVRRALAGILRSLVKP